MPNRLPLLLLLALVGTLIPVATPSIAGPNKNTKLILHLVPTEVRKGASCFSNLPETPKGVVTQGDLAPQHYLAYVLIADFDTTEGLAGVQFGITYDDSLGRGIDIEHWQNCALYEWPMDDWPGSGTGNLLTWNQADDCQTSDPIPVGFFFLTAYSTDQLKIIPRPVDGLARVAMCGVGLARPGETADTLKPENFGWIELGNGPGYNPWDPDQNLQNIQNRFRPIKD